VEIRANSDTLSFLRPISIGLGGSEPAAEGAERSPRPAAPAPERPPLRRALSAELGRAGRVRELVPGAVARADAVFRWDRKPWCPEIL